MSDTTQTPTLTVTGASAATVAHVLTSVERLPLATLRAQITRENTTAWRRWEAGLDARATLRGRYGLDLDDPATLRLAFADTDASAAASTPGAPLVLTAPEPAAPATTAYQQLKARLAVAEARLVAYEQRFGVHFMDESGDTV